MDQWARRKENLTSFAVLKYPPVSSQDNKQEGRGSVVCYWKTGRLWEQLSSCCVIMTSSVMSDTTWLCLTYIHRCSLYMSVTSWANTGGGGLLPIGRLTLSVKLNAVAFWLAETPWAVVDRPALCDVQLTGIGLRSADHHTHTVAREEEHSYAHCKHRHLKFNQASTPIIFKSKIKENTNCKAELVIRCDIFQTSWWNLALSGIN